ncbi:MAG TPA: cupin domain-containing protein [Polyangiaceae bacterium]|nr:cupin domain-containing protein [Polyangiaceae bacterium]
MSSSLNQWSLKPEDVAGMPFRQLRPGVEIHVLHETPEGARTAVLRYAPGAEVPAHRHEGYEYIYVLEGEQSDERGRYGPGSFVVNAPGTTHRVTSQGGCTVLILWVRPVIFLE